jgi:Papain family cysteine protease
MQKIFILFIFGLSFLLSCRQKHQQLSGMGMKANSAAALEAVQEADIDEDELDLPASFELNGPPIMAQGETNRCTAFAMGYYITSMYNGVAEEDFANSGSPDYLYGLYKKINQDGECNAGCYMFSYEPDNIIGAAEILKQYGTTSWQQAPFTDTKTCPAVTKALTEQAARNKVKDYYRIDKDEAANVQELKSWIYAGYPLFLGVETDEMLQNLQADEIWAARGSEVSEFHAMVCMGYDDEKNAFKLANSWGKDWADNGYCWVDYDFLVELLADEGAEIGVLIPNDLQRFNMAKASPVTCGSANWGDIIINNKRNEEVAIEMTGDDYTNTDAHNIDATEQELFTLVPAGRITVKIFSADKKRLLQTVSTVVATCRETVIDVR